MNSVKILKISIIVVVLVAIIYFVVGIFLGSTGGNLQKFSQHDRGSMQNSTEGTDKMEVPLDGVVITLGGGKYHYMKADISLKMKNSHDKKMIERNIRDVRDLILRYTSVQNSDRLITSVGKQRYKDDLKKIIYDTFGYNVEDIYFRNFVLAP